LLLHPEIPVILGRSQAKTRGPSTPALFAVLALALPAAAHAEGVYARAGAGYERSSEDRLRAPGGPALAQGDLGGTPVGDLGLGWRATSFVRIEALGSWRPGLAFAGAEVDSLSALAVGWVDLGVYGKARPFLGAGVGVARNRLEGEGRSTETAWMAAAGVAWPLSPRATLDVAYRYLDLGHVRTAAARAGLVSQGLAASVRWGF
jgi:opacity protein-like surface antigen